jgi:hypothetical protein
MIMNHRSINFRHPSIIRGPSKTTVVYQGTLSKPTLTDCVALFPSKWELLYETYVCLPASHQVRANGRENERSIHFTDGQGVTLVFDDDFRDW